MRRFAVLTLFALSFGSAAWPQTTGGATVPAGADAPAITGLCFTNVVGLGMCGLDEFCGGLQECDAANPCPDGKFCALDTCCPSTLGGVCGTPIGDPAGCSNAATCGSYETCDFVLAHEDFTGLGTLSSTVCGAGSALFGEDACPDSDFAPSPLDHGRWGVGAGSCSSYASAQHRVVAAPPPVDTSSCARAVLDFDYLFDIDGFDGAGFDRGFVTVAVDGGDEKVVATNQWQGSQAFTFEGLSCAGGVVPIGNMIADGTWHHLRLALGDVDSVGLKFYGETADNLFNSGQGWFFDDLRVDCGDLIFADGFEGANLLNWADTTAPPIGFTVDPPGSCGDWLPCNGPAERCWNVESAEGPAYCINDFSCVTSCTDSGDCAAGEFCAINTCCGEPVCAPAGCDPDFELFSLPSGPLAGQTGTMAGISRARL